MNAGSSCKQNKKCFGGILVHVHVFSTHFIQSSLLEWRISIKLSNTATGLSGNLPGNTCSYKCTITLTDTDTGR